MNETRNKYASQQTLEAYKMVASQNKNKAQFKSASYMACEAPVRNAS